MSCQLTAVGEFAFGSECHFFCIDDIFITITNIIDHIDISTPIGKDLAIGIAHTFWEDSDIFVGNNATTIVIHRKHTVSKVGIGNRNLIALNVARLVVKLTSSRERHFIICQELTALVIDSIRRNTKRVIGNDTLGFIIPVLSAVLVI